MAKISAKMEELKMKQDIVATEFKKESFIKEMTEGGLGEKILKEPNKIQKKLGFWDKIKKIF